MAIMNKQPMRPAILQLKAGSKGIGLENPQGVKAITGLKAASRALQYGGSSPQGVTGLKAPKTIGEL